jgi:hypothetical protein
MEIGKFLNSQLGLLLLGLAFTSVAGGVFARWLQEKSWLRQTKVDLFRKRYEDGVLFLDHLSELIGKRSFALQRLLWAAARKHDQEAVGQLNRKYFAIVFLWNSNYWKNRNKIRLLVGEEQANAFLDYADDWRPEEPVSLHYTFVKAHRYVLLARKGEIDFDAAQVEVDRLKVICSEFLEHLTTEFADRANRLQLLVVPEMEGKPRRAKLPGTVDVSGVVKQLRSQRPASR